MKRQHVAVKGIWYHKVTQQGDIITLSSDLHFQTLTTTMEELKTQYGVKTAYFVGIALNEARRQDAHRV